MKRLLTTLVLLAAGAFFANAIKAPRTSYKALQPDGTVITLVNHGDEFHHWTTTTDGTPVRQDFTGRWLPASLPPMSAAARIRQERAKQMRAEAAENSISLGEKRFVVILIEFSDLEFALDKPNEAFTNQLNQEGYSEHGGTGSVRDFYIENSSGRFIPTYDVLGPVKLSREYSYYGKNDAQGSDTHPDEALYEACCILDPDVDFSVYDNDGDGVVDNVFFYYAGHNEAEGGGSNTIWPHAWSLYGYEGVFDGVRVFSYACASELKNSSGRRMCGIGTFTHEFGHVLGLPDFYDTDYEANGEAETLGSFSTMDSGCYNNESRTPPRFNAVERNILGWMDEPEELLTSGPVTLESISANKAYCTLTSKEGESFIYEVRDGTGWDKPLPSGVVIYHLDKSDNMVGRFPANYLWMIMYDINCRADHPCFYVEKSAGVLWPMEYAIFPGAMDVNSFDPVEWSGNKTPFMLEGIAMGDGSASVTLKENTSRLIRGKITDSFGVPVVGAHIVAKRGDATVAPASAPSYGTTTGVGGQYSLRLSTEKSDGTFTLAALSEGYASQSLTVDMRLRVVMDLDFMLEPAEGNEQALNILGYNTIATPSGLVAGDTFDFLVLAAPGNGPQSVAWYWDGSPAAGTSATLTSGSHSLKAVQTFSDRTEELFLEFTVD